jgi:hypothetical protein
MAHITKSVSFGQLPQRATKFKLAELKNVYISKDFGFTAAFPAEVDELSLKLFRNAKGFAAFDASEKDERVIMYQIITSEIDQTEHKHIKNEEDAYKAIQALLDVLKKMGEEYDNVYKRSLADSQPMIKFTCKQNDLFGDGITSFKHGFAIINKDRFYRVMVHGIKNNQELEEAARRFFATFSFIASHEGIAKKNGGDKNNRPWGSVQIKHDSNGFIKNWNKEELKKGKGKEFDELQNWLDNSRR